MSIDETIVKKFEKANGRLFNPPLAAEIKAQVTKIISSINNSLCSAGIEGEFDIEDLRNKDGSLVYFITDRHYTNEGYKPDKTRPKSKFECSGFEVFSERLEFVDSRMINHRHSLPRNDKDGLIEKIENKLSDELNFYLDDEDKIKLHGYLVSQAKSEAGQRPAP